jgi:hypothetical protein
MSASQVQVPVLIYSGMSTGGISVDGTPAGSAILDGSLAQYDAPLDGRGELNRVHGNLQGVESRKRHLRVECLLPLAS